MVTGVGEGARSYWVTGVVPARGQIWGNWGVRDLVLGGGTIGVMLAATLMHMPVWVTLSVFGVGGGLFVVARVGAAVGDPVGDRVSRWWPRWLAGVAGVNDHSAGVPLLAGRVRTLEVGATVDHPGVAMFEVRGAGGVPEWYTAMVFIDGASRGHKDVGEDERLARQFGLFLNRVADQGLPVDQVDVVTRVCPDNLDAYQTANEASWTGPVDAVRAVQSLVGEMRDDTACVSSWLVIRMPVRLLRSSEVTGELVDVAVDAVDRVISLADVHGLEPRANATVRRVGAMLRNVYDPDEPLDDLTGITEVWDGVPAWRATRSGVVTDAWTHCVGVVDRDGWPWSPVHADWLTPVLVAPGNRTPVILQVQYPLVPRVPAMVKARAATVTARGTQYQNAQTGRVSMGDEADQETAAGMALESIRHGSAGVAPVVRVVVSGVDARSARRAREDMKTRMLSAGFTSVSWCDKDHARQLACVWPLGRGVRYPS